MTNNLQNDWFDESVEQAYVADIRTLIEGGNADKAAEKLLTDIKSLDTQLSSQCLYLRPEVDGWDEMSEAINDYEGDPITAVHIMLSNDDDLSFEDRDAVFEPLLEAALYSDEFYPFSKGDIEAIRAESLLPDRPWYGQGEDMEIFLEFIGMGEFNTALLRHKRQYFFRDEMHELDKLQGMAEGIVPLPYIEFMLCSMYRTVLYHQAIKSLVDSKGLPNNIPVLVGTHNMKFNATSVYQPIHGEKIIVKEMADLNIPIKREVIVEPEVGEVRTFRQKVLGESPFAAQVIAASDRVHNQADSQILKPISDEAPPVKPEIALSDEPHKAGSEPIKKIGFFRRLFRRKNKAA